MTRELGELSELGFEAEEIDLRHHFRDSSAAEVLRGFDVVWVRGGNVFALRAALANSGADLALAQLVRDGAIVYGGYSAGACVLAPSLRGLERVDDPSAPQLAYGSDTSWDGLHLLGGRSRRRATGNPRKLG